LEGDSIEVVAVERPVQARRVIDAVDVYTDIAEAITPVWVLVRSIPRYGSRVGGSTIGIQIFDRALRPDKLPFHHLGATYEGLRRGGIAGIIALKPEGVPSGWPGKPALYHQLDEFDSQFVDIVLQVADGAPGSHLNQQFP